MSRCAGATAPLRAYAGTNPTNRPRGQTRADKATSPVAAMLCLGVGVHTQGPPRVTVCVHGLCERFRAHNHVRVPGLNPHASSNHVALGKLTTASERTARVGGCRSRLQARCSESRRGPAAG